jgi:hypothetical protein
MGVVGARVGVVGAVVGVGVTVSAAAGGSLATGAA